MIQSISLEDALDKTVLADIAKSDHIYGVLFSLTECDPCDVLHGELARMGSDGKLGFPIYVAKIDQKDKKQVGKAVLSGISSFPQLTLFKDGLVVSSMKGVSDQGADALSQDLLRHFKNLETQR